MTKKRATEAESGAVVLVQPLVQRICFVDDDEDNRRQWLEWAERRGLSATAFESAFDANRTSADAFVFDVSAVSPMMVGHHAYAPICRLMADHPGAEIIVGSCMSRNAVEDVLDDVERVAGRRPLFFDASEGFRGLERVMDTLNASSSATAGAETNKSPETCGVPLPPAHD